MPISYTLQEAVTIRNGLKDALVRAYNSKSYRIGTRRTEHQDIVHLRKELDYWDLMVSFLEGRGTANSARQGVPTDR